MNRSLLCSFAAIGVLIALVVQGREAGGVAIGGSGESYQIDAGCRQATG